MQTRYVRSYNNYLQSQPIHTDHSRCSTAICSHTFAVSARAVHLEKVLAPGGEKYSIHPKTSTISCRGYKKNIIPPRYRQNLMIDLALRELLRQGIDKRCDGLVLETTVISYAHDYDNEAGTLCTTRTPQLMMTRRPKDPLHKYGSNMKERPVRSTHVCMNQHLDVSMARMIVSHNGI